eukprot:1955439-Alexandrium_andersonii.AAC.1
MTSRSSPQLRSVRAVSHALNESTSALTPRFAWVARAASLAAQMAAFPSTRTSRLLLGVKPQGSLSTWQAASASTKGRERLLAAGLRVPLWRADPRLRGAFRDSARSR